MRSSGADTQAYPHRLFAKKHKIFTFYLPALILVAALTLTACGGGQICFKGEDITRARGRRRKQLRRQMQMIF